MNYGIVKFTSFVIMLALIWMNYYLEVSQGSTIMMVVGMVACGVFIIYSRGESISYARRKHQIPLDASAEYAEEVKRGVDWMEGRESSKDFRKIGMIFLVVLATLHLTGCASQLMWVDYGLERMSSADKVKLGEVLNTAPDGRRVSWYNKSSNSQYTITPVQSYWAPGGQDAHGNPTRRACREYLVDDVYPYNAPGKRRGHMQITEFACYDPHQERWYAINGHVQRPWFRIGGPNYYDRRRN